LRKAIELFKKEGYDAQRVDNDVLIDDFRLVAAKYANLISGKKTEFKDEKELISFTENIVKEILDRDLVSFHPSWKVTDGRVQITNGQEILDNENA
jgi:hypothetical protein